MNPRLPLVVASFLLLSAASVACAGASSSPTDSSAAAESQGTGEASPVWETKGDDRIAVLDVVQKRVNQDFAKAHALAGYKLVLTPIWMHQDINNVFLNAKLQKQDASGKLSELVQADFEGTVYFDTVADARLNDTSSVQAVLAHAPGGGWTLDLPKRFEDGGAAPGTTEAYGVNVSGEVYNAWPQYYGLNPNMFLDWIADVYGPLLDAGHD